MPRGRTPKDRLLRRRQERPPREPRRDAQHRNRRRATPTNIAFWRRLRASVLAEEPVCVICRRAPATEVDHIDGDTANNLRSNLRGLCVSCHSRETNRMLRERYGRRAPGCDVTGRPLEGIHEQ